MYLTFARFGGDSIYRPGETIIYVGDDATPMSTLLTASSNTIVADGFHPITSEQSGRYIAVRRDTFPALGGFIGQNWYTLATFKVY